MLKKSKKADLKSKYTRYVEISLILALSLLILAFKYFPEIQSGENYAQKPQILIDVENVTPTQQKTKPPEPVKPDPIAVLANEDTPPDDIEFEGTDIDFTKIITAPPKYFEDDETEAEPAIPYFEVVEKMPEPVGGIAGIQEKIAYPDFAVRAGIEGKVYVKAYVNIKGEVDKVELVKGIGMGCDEEAMKAVSSTRFNPGMQRGKPVPVKITVPIKFVLKR
ncbi:MAG: protein TonB [Melioribacteraceae bacterium]|nr:MAG: protein TonB [Melioribacteraceae bacterium]